jgi:hypothetical protein
VGDAFHQSLNGRDSRARNDPRHRHLALRRAHDQALLQFGVTARRLFVGVLEGSVRKTANGTVRVTAQLIDGQTGDHVWASRLDKQGDVVTSFAREAQQHAPGLLSGRTGRFNRRVKKARAFFAPKRSLAV